MLACNEVENVSLDIHICETCRYACVCARNSFDVQTGGIVKFLRVLFKLDSSRGKKSRAQRKGKKERTVELM